MPKFNFGRNKDKNKEKVKETKAGPGHHGDRVPRKTQSSSSFSPSHQSNRQTATVGSASSMLDVGPSDSRTPSPGDSSQDAITQLVPTGHSQAGISRRDSGVKVAAHKAFYEDLSNRSGAHSPRQLSSPEKSRRRDQESSSSLSTRITVSVTSPTQSGDRTPSSLGRGTSGSSSPSVNKRSSFFETSNHVTTEIGREKSFDGIHLPLPPLQTTAVRVREVEARRNLHGGGFGFILRKSFLPVLEEPDKTKLVHLIEPRVDYLGPLMTGDRIIEVNGEVVEDAPHEMVVEMIKASGSSVSLKVVSMPELLELNTRGALDGTFQRNTAFRKSGKAKQGTGLCVPKGSKFLCE